jgi:hypothetical protein
MRRYSISGGCNQRAICDQLITAKDDQPPTLLCSGTIIQAVDTGCDYATVTFTNLAVDSCGELLGLWDPVTTGRFPIGTNTIIVIATDLANNSSVCTFDVAVVGPPIILKQPTSRTNVASTSASFSVLAASAAPMTYQWTQNGSALRDDGRVSGATNSLVTVANVSESDATDYQVQVSNFAGTTSSDRAHLTVIRPGGSLRILDYTRNTATLQMTGAAGNSFSILTSTNLADWVSLQTNVAPFTLVHTNLPWVNRRFFRAAPAL